ncbi:MAG: hypothetical protein AAF530_24535 [Pseudomonadota bacterium]
MIEKQPTLISRPIFLGTTLGSFRFQASVRPHGPNPPEVLITERQPTNELPKGMTIENCRAVVLEVIGPTGIDLLRFQCLLGNSDVAGSPCTGQGLVAQEWHNEGNLVVVGTEDEEFLGARQPFLSCRDPSIVSSQENTITIELKDISVPSRLSLHFVLAENPYPEPVDASAWFAVDCPHKLLL